MSNDEKSDSDPPAEDGQPDNDPQEADDQPSPPPPRRRSSRILNRNSGQNATTRKSRSGKKTSKSIGPKHKKPPAKVRGLFSVGTGPRAKKKRARQEEANRTRQRSLDQKDQDPNEDALDWTNESTDDQESDANEGTETASANPETTDPQSASPENQKEQDKSDKAEMDQDTPEKRARDKKRRRPPFSQRDLRCDDTQLLDQMALKHREDLAKRDTTYKEVIVEQLKELDTRSLSRLMNPHQRHEELLTKYRANGTRSGRWVCHAHA